MYVLKPNISAGVQTQTLVTDRLEHNSEMCQNFDAAYIFLPPYKVVI